jgi:tRNA-dihydrouridine synthase A
MLTTSDHTFCIAPMMDWTDRHERFFLRLFSRQAFLYTEMVTSAALVNGDSQYLLSHSNEEHPLGIQIGGSNPAELATASKLAKAAGFTEINLNIGCPSDRVQSGRFGACLMTEPELVAECVGSIADAVDLPVTVKCRIGINDIDTDEALGEFIATVSHSGCELFIIHARIALLEGLSPKQNREIPPLNYERVFAMKRRFPELKIVINGGITDLIAGKNLLKQVDGVMVGREAYQNPFSLSQVDSLYFDGQPTTKSRLEYLQEYLPYIQQELEKGTPLHHMTRHILGLFRGVSGGKNFRRHLSENSCKSNASINVLLDAMAVVS